MQTLEVILAGHPFFEGLEQPYLDLITSCASNVRFDAGEHLLREGESADQFYLLRHGRVALETYAPPRGPITVETIEAGEVLGWSWLFPPYQWHFGARALTPVRATAFDGACLRRKCDEDPALGYELVTRFAQVILERLQWTRLRLLDVYGDGA